MSRIRYAHIAMGLVVAAFPAAFGCGADRSFATPDRTGLDREDRPDLENDGVFT